ncbi:MAG: hypothetical protein JST82_05795 [Bacteroidetes bacterium]|nr:hypothetical protein [Bacteroidota bacterium]
MKKIIYISLVLACIAGQVSYGQNKPAPKDDINKLDAFGRRTGMWVINQPANKGEGGLSEFGAYNAGLKTGLWYKVSNEEGMLAAETFKNNVLDGEVKYYEKGKLTCIGYYRGLNPTHDFDTIFVTDPVTHDEIRRIVPTEKGTMRHGTWRFYDADNGRLVREEDYQLDELVYHRDFDMSKADSVAMDKRQRKLPHNKNKVYEPPISKQVSYTNNKTKS